MAEWLRRWTRNPLGSPCAGSNPADYVAYFIFSFFQMQYSVVHLICAIQVYYITVTILLVSVLRKPDV